MATTGFASTLVHKHTTPNQRCEPPNRKHKVISSLYSSYVVSVLFDHLQESLASVCTVCINHHACRPRTIRKKMQAFGSVDQCLSATRGWSDHARIGGSKSCDYRRQLKRISKLTEPSAKLQKQRPQHRYIHSNPNSEPEFPTSQATTRERLTRVGSASQPLRVPRNLSSGCSSHPVLSTQVSRVAASHDKQHFTQLLTL